MNILIIGATGFIGRELMKELEQNGHLPVAITRNSWKAREIFGEKAEIIEWDGISPGNLARNFAGIDAIVNLAGENIASGRWTKKRKKEITESRIKTGKLLRDAIRISNVKPSVLIQGSAIGFYGPLVEEPAGESSNAGNGFMADLTQDWESSVEAAGKMVPRIVLIRTGLVLGKNGGLLEKMVLPFKYNFGTVIGSGNQWMSWIHIKDQVKAIRFLLENQKSSGPYNLTAPNPVQMKAFIESIGETLGKPVRFKVPGFFLKAALGKMAKDTVLSSQNIYPGKLLKEGFDFEYPQLLPALKNLLINQKS
jgi:uncharacterized protein (TIGR01777 family)